MAKKKMNGFDWLVYILVIIGSINWGLVGAFNFNLVEFISFGMSWLAKTIYIIVGVSGIYGFIRLFMIK